MFLTSTLVRSEPTTLTPHTTKQLGDRHLSTLGKFYLLLLSAVIHVESMWGTKMNYIAVVF